MTTLRAWLARPALSLVLMRDARRIARRPRLWVLRVTMTAAVALICLRILAESPAGESVASMAMFTRGTTAALATLLSLFALAIGPVLGTLAVVEERDDNCGELLAMTRLRPYQLFAGKVMARLLGLGTTMLGVLPLLAVIQTYGGLSNGEVLMAVLLPMWVAVLMASVSAAIATHTRQVVSPVLLTWSWALVALILLPLVAQATTGGFSSPGSALAMNSPLLALLDLAPSGRSRGLLPPWWTSALYTLPVLLAVMLRGGASMNLAVGGGEVRGGPDRRWLERVVVVQLLAAPTAVPFLLRPQALGLQAYPLVVAAAQILLTGVWIDVSGAILPSERLRNPLRSLHLVRRLVHLPLRRVDPLFRREFLGRGHGPSPLLVWSTAALWFTLAALLFGVEIWDYYHRLSRGFSPSQEMHFANIEGMSAFFAGTTLFLAGPLVVTAAAGAIDEERREDVGLLLAITTASTSRLLHAKLAGALGRTAPVVLGPLALLWATWLYLPPQLPDRWEHLYIKAPSFLNVAAHSAWVAEVWVTLALTATAVSLLVPHRRLAWIANLGGLVLFPFFAACLFQRAPSVLFPFAEAHWSPLDDTLSTGLLVALFLWAWGLVVAWGVAHTALRWRLTRGG